MPLASALVGHNPACEECVALRESLAGKRWDALDDAWLERHDADLSLLTATGLRYYLPAYLRRAAREPRWSGGRLTVMNLDPHERGQLDPWMLARLDRLDAKQVAVIRAFLAGRADSPELEPEQRAEAARVLAWWSARER